MRYIYSTSTNDNLYSDAVHVEGGLQLPKVSKKVLVKGGANRSTKHLITPKGIMTSVSDEDFEFLQNNAFFKEHVKGGFLSFSDKIVTVDEAVANMEKKDASAPKTPDDEEYQLSGNEEVDETKAIPVAMSKKARNKE